MTSPEGKTSRGRQPCAKPFAAHNIQPGKHRPPIKKAPLHKRPRSGAEEGTENLCF